MNEQTIGANIRSLREKAQLTLSDLAGRAGITKSTLSKIETGRISSPIATMLRIAAALELPLAELFTESETTTPCVLTPKGKGQIINRDGSRFGYSYEALALGMKNKGAEPFLLTIQPGDPVGRFRHGGEEFIYMLSGCMQFTIGKQAVRLGPGDSLYFDPRQEHRTQILGKKPARFLCLFIQKESTFQRRK